MSYSSNPLLPKARADVVRLLVVQQLPVAVAARKSGIHRTTLWRWHKHWQALNEHVQFTNDTVHLYDHATKGRTYLYTLVDAYSRWSYSEHHAVLSQSLAAAVVRRGEAYAGFHFQMVQADNGPEYGQQFEELLKAGGTNVRHSRVRRPNDNAFIERFNRTTQEECTGSLSPVGLNLQSKVLTYLAYYNDERLHLGIQCQTPAEMLRRC